MSSLLISLRKELQSNSDEKLKESSKRFFKEKIKVYGMKTSLCSQISKKYYSEIKNKNKKEIFELCEELFNSGYMEESFIGTIGLITFINYLKKRTLNCLKNG